MEIFSDLTEREVPTDAIASEEDGRICMGLAENPAKRHPGVKRHGVRAPIGAASY
jgi:hypothetical protein